MTPRQPDWDLDRLDGEEAEQYVARLRRGIGAGTIEVKRDDGTFKWGNAYIEYECFLENQGWRPSGIATTKSDNWAHVCWPIVVIVPTWVLRTVAREGAGRGELRECKVGSNPTRGVALPLQDLFNRAFEVVARPATDSEAA